jgi:hypothetical protein
VCRRHGICAKVSERSQIIFKNYLVEFQEEGGRTSWDEGKVRRDGELGSHKTHRRGCGIRARARERASNNKKRIFIGETQKGGVTLLESAPQGQKSSKMKG